ncbi:MAG: lysylphosphatidylglycerol synthase transmembrane domain-containing protein [Candidatus Nitrosoglobus sp.]
MASAEIKSWGDWRFRALLVSVALSALGYLAISLWGGWREVLHAVSAIGLIGTVIVLGLSLVNYGLRFVRWQHYLQLLAHPLPLALSLRIYLAGFALTTTPGKAGEMLRSVFLKYYGMPYPKSLAAFFAERLCDFIAVLILVAASAWHHESVQLPIFGLGAALVLGLILLHTPRWLRRIEIWIEYLSRPRLQAILVSVIEIVSNFRRCFSFSTMAYAVFLGLFAWGAEGLELYYIVNWMGGEISLVEAVFIYAFSVLIGALSFLPGGLGSTEVTMIGLLLLNGMGEAQAVACTLFVRVVTLWFAVALGLLVLPRKV